ncbi:MAG: 4Fe-4S binding protein [Planctomycetes bacterium]|nr:4Fe-4S binding protein [Planctomycetota bacterium]
MEAELRDLARRLLESGEVAVVIGYRRGSNGDGAAPPAFVRSAADADQLIFDATCRGNLARYLLRPDVKALGKAAVVLKGCDARALVQLRVENKVAPGSVVAIGVACDGVRDAGGTIASKCVACRDRDPANVDHAIGKAGGTIEGTDRVAERIADLEKATPAERWRFWTEELSRCVRCHACRQACPLCYCERCIADKSQPRWIDTSPHLRGNLAFHIIRAQHLGGRCVGCGQCEEACPVGIPLMLLNRKLSDLVVERFQYEAGRDPEAKPAIGDFRLDDDNSFFR